MSSYCILDSTILLILLNIEGAVVKDREKNEYDLLKNIIKNKLKEEVRFYVYKHTLKEVENYIKQYNDANEGKLQHLKKNFQQVINNKLFTITALQNEDVTINNIELDIHDIKLIEAYKEVEENNESTEVFIWLLDNSSSRELSEPAKELRQRKVKLIEYCNDNQINVLHNL